MEVRGEFQLGGFAFGGKEIRPVEKLDGFREPGIAAITFAGGDKKHRGGLQAAPVDEFC